MITLIPTQLYIQILYGMICPCVCVSQGDPRLLGLSRSDPPEAQTLKLQQSGTRSQEPAMDLLCSFCRQEGDHIHSYVRVTLISACSPSQVRERGRSTSPSCPTTLAHRSPRAASEVPVCPLRCRPRRWPQPPPRRPCRWATRRLPRCAPCPRIGC